MASDLFVRVMGRRLDRELGDLDRAWASAVSGEHNAGTGGYGPGSPYLDPAAVRAAMYAGEDAADPAYGAVADIYLHAAEVARRRAAGQDYDEPLNALLYAYRLARTPEDQGGGGCDRNAPLFDNRCFRHRLEDSFGKDAGVAGYGAGGLFSAAMDLAETLDGLGA